MSDLIWRKKSTASQIDDAVIVRQCDVHHRLNRQFAAARYRTIVNGVEGRGWRSAAD